MEQIFEEPHIRKNILTGENILVSPHRTKRPWQGKIEEDQKVNKTTYDPNCYLCPGNIRANNEKTAKYKDTFVFVNDYAALKPNIEFKDYKEGLLEASGEKGICKVICFSPNHSLTLSKMEVNDIVKVITVLKSEFHKLSQKPFINYIQIFENRGELMGCSNPHPHGQIWAQQTVPNEIIKKTEQFEKYFINNKKTLLESYLEQEIKKEERIVFENEHFVVLVPFWAVWPFETMIIPKKAASNILSIKDTNSSSSFAEAIKTITSIYDRVFDVPFPYSAGIHQMPTDDKAYLGWHWHMSFYPPLLRSASIKKFMVGYEMFAMSQRDLTAESAAKILKSLL